MIIARYNGWQKENIIYEVKVAKEATALKVKTVYNYNFLVSHNVFSKFSTKN